MDVNQFYNTLDDLVLSFIIIFATVYLCNLFRLLYVKILSYSGFDNHEYRMAAIEMIGTIEVSVIIMELNLIIQDVYGIPIYCTMVWLSLWWQNKRNKDFKYYANPSLIAAKCVQARRGGFSLDGNFSSLLFCATLIAGELAGAALAYYFIIYVAWGNAHHFAFWRSSNYHMKRSGWGSLLSASIPYSMGVEGLFSFLNYLIPSLVEKHTNFTGDGTLMLIWALKALFCGIGYDSTGAYYNPILATAVEYPAGGSSLMIKAQVYWLAPTVGTIAAMLIS